MYAEKSLLLGGIIVCKLSPSNYNGSLVIWTDDLLVKDRKESMYLTSREVFFA